MTPIRTLGRWARRHALTGIVTVGLLGAPTAVVVATDIAPAGAACQPANGGCDHDIILPGRYLANGCQATIWGHNEDWANIGVNAHPWTEIYWEENYGGCNAVKVRMLVAMPNGGGIQWAGSVGTAPSLHSVGYSLPFVTQQNGGGSFFGYQIYLKGSSQVPYCLTVTVVSGPATSSCSFS